MKKRMLIVYPNNFLQGMQGTNTRVYELVKIFKELDYTIDFLGYENFTPDSSFQNFDELNKDKLIENLYIYDFHKPIENGKNIFIEKIKNKLERKKNLRLLQDWVPLGAKRLFDKITNENEYDVVILFYTYLANLLKDKQDSKYKKVYFMEDSMFLQQYTWDKDSIKNISLGKLMDEEIERLNYFDEYFCISYDEKLLYEKLTGKIMSFLPHLSDRKIKEAKVQKPLNERKWDVFFIGFNNPFNVEGLNWFLEEVYPYLDKNLKILLVGSATQNIKVSYSNIDIIQFAPDLDEIFENVKVSICPMFRGTGMKIKVVESMERGIPVVCNERGVDGFPDKTECGCLVTQKPRKFAEYINILVKDEKYYKERSNQIKLYYNKIFKREDNKNLIRGVLENDE